MRRGENIFIYVNGELKGTTHIGNITINNTDLPVYIGRVGYGLNTHAAFISGRAGFRGWMSNISSG